MEEIQEKHVLKPELLKGFTKWSGVKPAQYSDEQWYAALEYWIRGFERHCEAMGIPAAAMAMYVPMVVEPAIAGALISVLSGSYAGIVASMRMLWGIKGGNARVLTKIQERNQRAGEPIGLYAVAHKHLQGLLTDDLANRPELQLPSFRQGLSKEPEAS